MEPMTPEERYTKIDNLLQTLTEGQVQLQAQQAALTEAQIRNEAEIEKQHAAIRDLIVVSRTLVDSQKKTWDQIQELKETQKVTEEKLHILVQKLDRIIGKGI